MNSTLKYRDVSNDAIKLMLFPYSLEGAARIWYEKEPPNSILTWDDLVNKFVNHFFPPSKTTHLKNVISYFTQRFEETFGEAWERFKEMLRACPHHGFSELTQIDTFYNGLNEQDQDSLNAAAGGNLLSKTTREALKIIENKLKVRYSRSKSNVSRVNTNSRDNASKTDNRIDKVADQISNLVEIVNKQFITPATAKAVEKTCVICGGAHAYYDCIATDSNQPSVCAAIGIPNELSSYMKSNEIMIKSMQNQINALRGNFNKQEENLRRNLNNDMRSILGSFFQNQASTLGTLLSNTVPNPKGEMKAVTTRSGLAYEGPSIPTNSPLEKVVERDTEEIMDKEHSNCQGSTAHIQPPVKLQEKAMNQIEKFFQIFHDLHFDISFADALLLMPKFASTIKRLLTNKDKLFELAKVPLNENYSVMLFKKLLKKLRDPDKFLIPCDFPGIDVCHALADLGASINLMPLSIWKKLSLPELTPTRMTLELADSGSKSPLILGRSFLRTGRALIDVHGEEITLRVNDEFVTFNLNQTMRYSSTYVDNFVNQVDVIDIACEEFVQDVLDFQYNPKSSNPTLMDLKQAAETKAKSSIEEPPELELKGLPSHLEYAFLEESDKLLVIIAKDLKDVEKEALIKVLNSHKRAIAWKISYIKGIDPRFYTHKILMEEDYKPAVQIQKKPISDSPWVSPIHCVPKKGGMTVVANENNELIPTRLAGNEFYCFLDGFLGYFQFLIDPQDQEKTTFTCPYVTFAYRRMPFGLCNAPDTFQRCMITMFHDMIEKTMEVFMDNFSIFRDSFSSCLTNLDKMLKCCEDTNLVLNWEKCHFMCREGIILGHKILKSGIEVDRAKVDVIAKLPHPTIVKGVRSFLRHTGFENLAADHLSRLENPHKDVLENKDIKAIDILKACHEGPTRGHHGANLTAKKTSGQVEVSNRGLKRILERTAGENHASWSDKLDDALWAFHTAFKTPIGCTPYKLVYEKSCHLLIELEHRAYWALKHVNFDLKTAGDHQKLQLNELNELRDHAYENSLIYKEKTKKLHDSKIKNRIFNVGDQVLLFNSRLKIFSGKLKTRWSGPFTITQVFLYGTVELS
nr:reverse transcriptase domain-containing protein [Tanacetum cinerariifolium]